MATFKPFVCKLVQKKCLSFAKKLPMRFLQSYLRYLWCSVSRYRIHSPFIYQVSEVLHAKPPKDIIRLPEAVRKQLSSSQQLITVLDLGEGGKQKPNRLQKLGKLAATSSKRPKEGVYLYNLVAHFKPKVILELGTSLGISTMYLQLGCAESRIVTIEGCPERLKIAQENFQRHGFDKIECINGDFDVVLPELIKNGLQPDFVFVDGNHGLEPTLRYFELLAPCLHNDAVMVFDDIHWSVGMEQAWDWIASSDAAQVTVDLFSMGLVFFKKELSKQNFTILV